jgi:hypothetical protein
VPWAWVGSCGWAGDAATLTNRTLLAWGGWLAACRRRANAGAHEAEDTELEPADAPLDNKAARKAAKKQDKQDRRDAVGLSVPFASTSTRVYAVCVVCLSLYLSLSPSLSLSLFLSLIHTRTRTRTHTPRVLSEPHAFSHPSRLPAGCAEVLEGGMKAGTVAGRDVRMYDS